MIRLLVFLIVVFLIGLGFAWLADRPGEMVVTFQGYQYHVTLMVAAVTIVAIVAAVMLSWWMVKAIWNSPYTVARYFRVRQRDRGYQALSTGMIAASAGDGALARRKGKEAAKLIRSDQEPMILLLDAQASLLEGDHDGARRKFEAMVDDPELRLLGLRGLYLEAERLGDRAAARHYAGRAADLAPQLGWAAESTLDEKTAQGDWDGALKLLDAQKTVSDREAVKRRRAVLLTAKAMDCFETDPSAARAAALEANRLLPNFSPAAVVAARALFRNGDTRKGARILETAWKAEPHPDVADLYVHARHGDAVGDRLARARKLQSIKQNHPESAIAVARAAIDAGDLALARQSAESAIRMQPREGAYLLLADIEEQETGNIGKVRELLAKALRAPRDPAWVADGVESDRWAPLSPVTGRLDAFEWRLPVERLAHQIDLAEPTSPPLPERLAAPVASVDPAPAIAPTMPPSVEAVPEPVETELRAEVHAEEPEPAAPQPDRLAAEDAVPPPPDDPGVDPSARPSPKRFKLF
jgi:HemY protein